MLQFSVESWHVVVVPFKDTASRLIFTSVEHALQALFVSTVAPSVCICFGLCIQSAYEQTGSAAQVEFLFSACLRE